MAVQESNCRIFSCQRKTRIHENNFPSIVLQKHFSCFLEFCWKVSEVFNSFFANGQTMVLIITVRTTKLSLAVCRRVREVGLRRKKTEKKLWLYFLFLAVLLFSIAKFCITNYFKICFSKFIIATDIVLCFALTVSRYLCCTKSPSNLNIAPTAMGTPSAFKVPVRNEQHPVQVVTVSSSDAIPMCNEGKTVLLIQCMVSGEIGEEAGKISCICTTYRQSKK